MVRALACAVLLSFTSVAQAEPIAAPRTPLDEPRAPSPFAIGDADIDLPNAKKRGVIAGVDLAPDAAVGFGVFNAAPKRSLSTSDEKLVGAPRPSRKAGVGLSLKF